MATLIRIHPNREDPEAFWQIRIGSERHYAKDIIIHSTVRGHKRTIDQPEEDPMYEIHTFGVLTWEKDRVAVILAPAD